MTSFLFLIVKNSRFMPNCFYMPIFVLHGLWADIFLLNSQEHSFGYYLGFFGYISTTKKNFSCFYDIFFNRKNIAIEVVHDETLYSHLGYIKFCYKAL